MREKVKVAATRVEKVKEKARVIKVGRTVVVRHPLRLVQSTVPTRAVGTNRSRHGRTPARRGSWRGGKGGPSGT